MKQVVTVKLAPDADTRAVLVKTLRICNAEANRIAGVAFMHRDPSTGQVEREHALRGRVYAEAKQTGIGSQLSANRSSSNLVRLSRSTIDACLGTSTPGQCQSAP